MRRGFRSPRWLTARPLFDRRRAVLGILGITLAVGGLGCWPQPRVPAPPVAQSPGGAAPAAVRTPRPTPPPEVRERVASTDVVEAARAYVTALYTADDATAASYQEGYTELLRKDENELEMEDLTVRPMAWGEAGYLDADPATEWAEVVVRVHTRRGNSSGRVYYKLGFLREDDKLRLDLASRRIELR